MAKKLSIKDLQVSGKKVLMRVDFNVPLNGHSEITDDTRIKAALPTIQYILNHGGSLILMSHLGRPKGKNTAEFSLKPCAKRLSELLHQEVKMAKDCVGKEVEEEVHALKPKEILMLENLRFHRGEEHPEEEPQFVKQLAKLGDLYCNDAFGAAHRKHASTYQIVSLFPGKAASGFLLDSEIKYLGDTLKNPARPFVALIGGAKISSKLGVISALISKVDRLLIGGGMAFTFLKAQGFEIGASLCEEDLVPKAKKLLESKKIVLPVDIVVAEKIDEKSKIETVEKGVPKGYYGVDIGEKTVRLFTEELKKAKTVLWNGPLGIFEIPPFAHGTQEMAKVISGLNAVTVVGGGDSVSAVQEAGLGDKMSHVSTGGGACLEYLEFGSLPGIEALERSMIYPLI